MTDLTTPRPVPTREDRMRDATQPEIRVEVDRTRNTINMPASGGCVVPRTDFGTYLDRTERDQLDARAAAAEQERDDALDDLRDVLHDLQIAVGTDYTTASSAAIEAGRQIATLRRERDEARAELADAQELLAVVDDLAEQLDRARARYATRRQEQAGSVTITLDNSSGKFTPSARLGSPEARAQDEPEREDLRSPLVAERDRLVETIGRLVSLPPEQIAEMHKVGYSGSRAEQAEG